ncbi:MAG: sugar phosphate nucleotidyltransferase, partial [Patescibacteria group bacterium]
VFVANPPRLQQLIDVYETYGGPVLPAIKTNAEGTKKYGIIEGKKIGDRVMSVQSLLEKPGPDKAPSLWASVSGYVLTPDIFPILAQTKRGKGGEVWLTDALQVLASRRAMYAAMVDATYYDMGSKLGFLKANIEFALRRPELKGELRRYLKTITR